jgi:hypothetical protein
MRRANVYNAAIRHSNLEFVFWLSKFLAKRFCAMIRRAVLSLLGLLLLVPALALTSEREQDLAKFRGLPTKELLVNLTRLIEDQGFRQVRIKPQLFVAEAEGPSGKANTIIVDADTLQAFVFDEQLPLAKQPVLPLEKSRP